MSRRPLRTALAAWVLWRLFGPELEPRYPLPQGRPLRLPGRSVFVGDRELFVRETGPPDGPPLVLVHGWSLDGEMTFHRIIPPLADRFRLVVPDHRNHGKSDWVRGRFDIGDLADELAGVLDAIGVSAATLFGWSMGGMVTQEVARRRPDLASKIVLGATAARPAPRWRWGAQLAFWIGRAAARLSRQEMAGATTRVLLQTGSLDPAHARWMRSALMRRDPTLYYEAGAAVLRFDSTPWLGSLRQQAMVILTAEDQMVRPAAQRHLAALLAHAEVVELGGGRHEAILNRADEIAKAVSDFVDGR